METLPQRQNMKVLEIDFDVENFRTHQHLKENARRMAEIIIGQAGSSVAIQFKPLRDRMCAVDLDGIWTLAYESSETNSVQICGVMKPSIAALLGSLGNEITQCFTEK